MRSTALYGALFVATAQGFQPTTSFHGRTVAPKAMSTRCDGAEHGFGSRGQHGRFVAGRRRWSVRLPLMPIYMCCEQEAGPGRSPDVGSGQDLPVCIASRSPGGTAMLACVHACADGKMDAAARRAPEGPVACPPDSVFAPRPPPLSLISLAPLLRFLPRLYRLTAAAPTMALAKRDVSLK